jgi:D-alanine-D-alanine ligase
MKVALIFTGATEETLAESPEMVLNLADAPETIEAVKAALEAGGHTVIPLNTDRLLPAVLSEASFDIVFNIATGFYGDTKQADVPAMLEYLRIPHTGSGVLAEVLATHKPTMKTVLLARGLPTPPFQHFRDGSEPLDPTLRFPLIVKLPFEGGSLGMTPDSVVQNEAALRVQLALLLDKYRQGALAEAYLDGREFTVAVLGNIPPYMLPIVERRYFDDIRIQLDTPEPTTEIMAKQITGRDVEYIQYNSDSVAPADLTPDEAQQIESAAIGAYQALGCRDWARIDLRMDDRGTAYLFDVNLEPAIAPEYAVARAARAAGWTYTALVNRILEHALERYPWLTGQPSR